MTPYGAARQIIPDGMKSPSLNGDLEVERDRLGSDAEEDLGDSDEADNLEDEIQTKLSI